MEGYVYKLVENTLNNHSKEEAIEIIAEKILWYEMKLKQLKEEE